MPVDMKRLIASKFAEMTQFKPIDKITVKDLVEQCGISRQAFYYHFQDILEVMEWSIRQVIESALQKSMHAQTAEESIQAFIQVSMEYENFIIKLLSSDQHHLLLEQIFVDAMRSSIRQMLCSRKPDYSISHQDLEIAVNFCAYGVAGVLFENCKGPRMSAEQLSQKLHLLLSGQILPL